MKKKVTKVLAILIFLTLFISPSLVMGKSQNADAQGFYKRQNENRNFIIQTTVTPKPTQAQTGLMNSCLAREKAIKTRMTHLTNLATNMETKFASISARVEEYYTTKVVPSGKTVTNYNGLVSDIQTKKDAITLALSKAQNDVNNFSCTTSTDPKADLQTFRKDMQAVKSALKDYRTSIKDLIVSVRSVVGEENKETPTPTP